MSQPTPAPSGASAHRRNVAGLQRPSGWPVGSFQNYADAQAAVDGLSDHQFPVENITIVGVDLMQVERVTGRLTWGRVLAGGALSGLWFGLFVGLLFALFTPDVWPSLLSALVIGLIFGLVFAAIGYAFTQGRRDFSSATTIVAGRYDILCEPANAPQARDLIAQMGPHPSQNQGNQRIQPQQPPAQQPEQQAPRQHSERPAEHAQPQQPAAQQQAQHAQPEQTQQPRPQNNLHDASRDDAQS